MRALFVFVVCCVFGLVLSAEQTKISPSSSPLTPAAQNARFVEDKHSKEQHNRISNQATNVVSALKEQELISVFGHIWNSADANQRAEFSSAFGAKIDKADPTSRIRLPSTTPTIISDFSSLYGQVVPARRVEFVKKTLWDQLPIKTQNSLLSFIRLTENQHSNSNSKSKSGVTATTDPIRVWTSTGSDYSYYDACGGCDDWTVCEKTTGTNICIAPCTQQSDCFALFDSVRGRQYNGGCDIIQKQCIGFLQQPRISGTLPSIQLQKFRDWTIGRGIVVDPTGVVSDWGPKSKDQQMKGLSVNSNSTSIPTGTASAVTLSWIASVVIFGINLVY